MSAYESQPVRSKQLVNLLHGFDGMSKPSEKPGEAHFWGIAPSCLTIHDTRVDSGRSNVDHVLASRGLLDLGAVEYEQLQVSVDRKSRKLSDHDAVVIDLEKRTTSLN